MARTALRVILMLAGVIPIRAAPNSGLGSRVQLPLVFEPSDQQAGFVSRGNRYNLYLSNGEANLWLRGGHPAQVKFRLLGANRSVRAESLDPLPGKSHYLIGNDPAKWRTDVSQYGKVAFRQVYPGVDLVYYGNPTELEHDFLVSPGANPTSIRMTFDGARRLRLDANGDLLIEIGEGVIRQRRPVAYQPDGERRQSVGCAYVLEGRRTARFQLGTYDRARPLVIDPVIDYATYLGGSGTDAALAVAMDASGNTYVTGFTNSPNFPTRGPAQASNGGGPFDAFVTKLNASGTAVVYSTYFGGNGDDEGFGIAVDAAGNAYVTGFTSSSNFPVTSGAPQRNLGGGADAFVVKLNPSGSAPVYSTYLGGSGNDRGLRIALDSSGNAYLAGVTNSANFPTTPGVFQPRLAGGLDAFVAKLNAAGSSWVYSTYLGGASGDVAYGITVARSGAVYVAGTTSSTGFTATAGAPKAALSGPTDAFIAGLNASGSALTYWIYLGGSGGDGATAVFLEPSESKLWVVGQTGSTDFPVTQDAFQKTYAGGTADGFLTRLQLPFPATAVAAEALSPDSYSVNQGVLALLEYSTLIGTPVEDAAVGLGLMARFRPINFYDPANAYLLALASSKLSDGNVTEAFLYLIAAIGRTVSLFGPFPLPIPDVGDMAAIVTAATQPGGQFAVVSGSPPSGVKPTPGAAQPSSAGGDDGAVTAGKPGQPKLDFIKRLVSPSRADVKVGDTLVFEIVVENFGTVDAIGIQVDDEIPDGLSEINASASFAVTDRAGTVRSRGTCPRQGFALPELGLLTSILFGQGGPIGRAINEHFECSTGLLRPGDRMTITMQSQLVYLSLPSENVARLRAFNADNLSAYEEFLNYSDPQFLGSPKQPSDPAAEVPSSTPFHSVVGDLTSCQIICAVPDEPFGQALRDGAGQTRDVLATLVAANSSVESIQLAGCRNGSCRFSGTLSLPSGFKPSALFLADVNGDGRNDLLALSSASGSVAVFLNSGSGYSSTPMISPVGSQPLAFVWIAGAANRLAVARAGSPGDVAIFTVDRTGRLSTQSSSVTVGGNPARSLSRTSIATVCPTWRSPTPVPIRSPFCPARPPGSPQPATSP